MESGRDALLERVAELLDAAATGASPFYYQLTPQVADVSTDPMTEAAAALSRVRGALKQGKQAKDSDKATKKE